MVKQTKSFSIGQTFCLRGWHENAALRLFWKFCFDFIQPWIAVIKTVDARTRYSALLFCAEGPVSAFSNTEGNDLKQASQRSFPATSYLIVCSSLVYDTSYHSIFTYATTNPSLLIKLYS